MVRGFPFLKTEPVSLLSSGLLSDDGRSERTVWTEIGGAGLSRHLEMVNKMGVRVSFGSNIRPGCGQSSIESLCRNSTQLPGHRA